ncbi:hypothetical protein CGGC5_v005035 [Colletotrichum fructicola Nara gc5]|uniref:Uncharacterized protein n=1 Tax=Colletotrichum fructicola (strain Nara gc5) TaxID=1213859 RepID=A0A7J6JAT2_COLFN|nr:hypothetical protein CGGC5_v005035 [Colletotrichum fructicola Nara gc5]
MMWELDPSEDKGACPGKAMMQYLTNVAWQFGQNSDPSLRGEQLEFIIRSYADGAIDGAFRRGAEDDARAALHYAVKFSYDFYLTMRGSQAISDGTWVAAAILKEQAESGQRELANGTPAESYLALKDTNAQLAASHAIAIQERNDLQRQLYQRNHVAAIDAYADYVGRLLRAVRNRVRTAVRNKQILPKIAKAGPPHADFLARGMAARRRKEAVAIAK